MVVNVLFFFCFPCTYQIVSPLPYLRLFSFNFYLTLKHAKNMNVVVNFELNIQNNDIRDTTSVQEMCSTKKGFLESVHLGLKKEIHHLQ